MTMDEIVGAKGILTEPSPQENDMTPIRKIGIIGSGQMGNGIAHVIALAGYDVVLTDLTKEKVDKAIELIDRNLTRQVASGKITEEDRKQALSRITYAENYQGLSDADLVIEAATEDETVKRKIFVALCPFLKPEAIVATNTSSISITRLAAATDRPERFIGLHFMNPVPVMELVEMIRGIATEDVTFAADLLGSFQVGDNSAALTFPQTALIKQPVNNTFYTRTVQLTNIPDASRDDLVNLSAGFRFSPKPSVMMVGNVIVHLNSGGLRSDVVPTLGIEFTL
jgi:hypothetical protein